ncbi:MAG: hypothetical protein VX265_00520 [Myxococcota bacterium]|nr:hypothetical protein [Myxococcota bacterium]
MSSLLLLLSWGCVHQAAGTAVAPPRLWSLDVRIESSLTREDGGALDPALAPLASVSEQRRFDVRGEHAGWHGDGSQTTRLRFLSDSDPASGRVVDLRHFDSGEILALDWLEQAAGPGPGLDVLSVVFPVLSPKVPLVRRGRHGQMTTAFPVPVGPDRKVTERVRTVWKREGNQRVAGRSTLAVSYEGQWETHGEDAGHRPPVGVAGRGTVSGRVWLDVRDMSVVAHDFQWKRRVVLAYPGAQGDGLRLVQMQSMDGHVEQSRVRP